MHMLCISSTTCISSGGPECGCTGHSFFFFLVFQKSEDIFIMQQQYASSIPYPTSLVVNQHHKCTLEELRLIRRQSIPFVVIPRPAPPRQQRLDGDVDCVIS